MTRESWLFSGTRESLPRRAGYRNMRLNVVTEFGVRWASGTYAMRGTLGPTGGLAKPRQTEVIVAVSAAL